MKKSSLFVIAVLSIVSTLAVSAQGKKGMKEMKEVTITGEVIDQKCYLTGMNGARGEAHKECAILASKVGCRSVSLRTRQKRYIPLSLRQE